MYFWFFFNDCLLVYDVILWECYRQQYTYLHRFRGHRVIRRSALQTGGSRPYADVPPVGEDPRGE